jgi:valyl-tRNA synthetase
MESRYSPAELEKKWYDFWEKGGYFAADPSSDKPPYSILMPPPNLTGSLHLGHVMQHAIMDSVARYKRMQGHDVLLQPGVDHAGLQFQGVLDKKLSKEGINPKALSRDDYLKHAWQFKDENYNSVKQTFRQTGISADCSREVFTLDDKQQKAVFHEFKTYYDQGLIYKGPYLVNWCSKCGTAIEDVETEYVSKTESLYFVKYQVVDERPVSSSTQTEGSIQSPDSKLATPDSISPIGEITVATARPETMYADAGIAVYPNHPQFKQFVGRKAINPLNGQLLPIFEDNRVDKDFGTGALKITPGHDPLDYAIGADHSLPVVQVIGKDGKLNEYGDDLAGLKVDEARQQAAAKLQASNNIDHIEEYTHDVPVCERCKTTIEPLISEEWFVKMQPLAQKAIAAIGQDAIHFLPPNYAVILTKWLDNIHDWTISRSQIWGHRIPVWYKDGQQTVSFDSPGDGWIQDEQVLDTWFSSGLWPMSTLGWPEDTQELRRYYPWSLEVTAPEIKFLWITRMIMLGLWFTDQVPFTTMFFHGTLRDLKGQKFSKSLGNGIDPIRLFQTWGVDATRMTLISYSIPGRDGKASNQTIDERAKNYRNFATKLWNISRFILSYQSEMDKSSNEDQGSSDQLAASNQSSIAPTKRNPRAGQDDLHPDDQAVLNQLTLTIHKVTAHFDNFELHLAAETLYEFIWHDLADIYLEQSKSRRHEAQPTLEHILATTLPLLHPFMPFVTEEIWSQLPQQLKPGNQPLIVTPWPTAK